MHNVVVVSPHGDDEVLGFGAAIQKHVYRNDKVTVIFIKDAPQDNLRSQCRLDNTKDAKSILRYHDIEYLNISDNTISSNPLVFYKSLEALLIKLNPSIVYCPFWNDIHQDHTITFEYVARIIRVWGDLKVTKFLVGEIPSSTDQSVKTHNNIFTPNFYYKITSNELQTKINALNCYKSEMRDYPHPRSSKGIEVLARYRGMECGTEYAEAYMCLRNIN